MLRRIERFDGEDRRLWCRRFGVVVEPQPLVLGDELETVGQADEIAQRCGGFSGIERDGSTRRSDRHLRVPLIVVPRNLEPYQIGGGFQFVATKSVIALLLVS